jgi:hypothetical protein
MEKKPSGKFNGELNLLQPVTSQHLKVMYDRNMLLSVRKVPGYFYSLANNFIIKILDCMSEVQEKLDSGEWDLTLVNRKPKGSSMNDMVHEQALDCKGLNCPLPILKTKKHMMPCNQAKC